MFCGAIFLEKDQLRSRADLEKIYKDYYKDGLSKVNIYLYGNGERNMGNLIPPGLYKKISISSAESLFQNWLWFGWVLGNFVSEYFNYATKEMGINLIV